MYRGERWGPPVRAEERGPAEHEVMKDAVGTGKQGVRPLSENQAAAVQNSPGAAPRSGNSGPGLRQPQAARLPGELLPGNPASQADSFWL